MGQVVRLPARDGASTEPWVTAKALAAHLSVSVRTIHNWRGEGMPSIKYRNGARRYQIGECERWLRA